MKTNSDMFVQRALLLQITTSVSFFLYTNVYFESFLFIPFFLKGHESQGTVTGCRKRTLAIYHTHFLVEQNINVNLKELYLSRFSFLLEAAYILTPVCFFCLPPSIMRFFNVLSVYEAQILRKIEARMCLLFWKTDCFSQFDRAAERSSGAVF